MTRPKTVRIGGALGYWGEAPVATPQLLAAGKVDYLVYDYLAEITMSILARARAADPGRGYAHDFISDVIKPNLPAIARQRVKVIANSGGVNPHACGEQVRAVAKNLGLTLGIAVVSGDDLLPRKAEFAQSDLREMFSGEPLPAAATIASVNAYLGAFPIALALSRGADIVITGRCVDSALTLGACIHEFGWLAHDYDRLAAGSLAGHLLECGPQASGGNFTDWRDVADSMHDIGYPVAEIADDGSMIVSKPPGTGGVVTIGTVAEQMLYEIGDPQAYVLPDVVCDFSQVVISDAGPDQVRVAGAIGRPAPDTYKVSVTAHDGFRGGTYLCFYGADAKAKAEAYGAAVFRSARATLDAHGAPDFTRTSIEILGAESQFGDFARHERPREVVMKIAARHPQAEGIGAFLRALWGLGLAAPPGLSGFAGTRAKAMPVVRLHSFLLPRDGVRINVSMDSGSDEVFSDARGQPFDPACIERPPAPAAVDATDLATVPLVALAWGRSGDKGNKANVGIIARDPAYLPFIWAALSCDTVAARFAHFLDGAGAAAIERYLLPGSHAINFVLNDVLGGGGIASLRNDPQGKGYAQILLDVPVPVPTRIAQALS